MNGKSILTGIVSSAGPCAPDAPNHVICSAAVRPRTGPHAQCGKGAPHGARRGAADCLRLGGSKRETQTFGRSGGSRQGGGLPWAMFPSWLEEASKRNAPSGPIGSWGRHRAEGTTAESANGIGKGLWDPMDGDLLMPGPTGRRVPDGCGRICGRRLLLARAAAMSFHGIPVRPRPFLRFNPRPGRPSGQRATWETEGSRAAWSLESLIVWLRITPRSCDGVTEIADRTALPPMHIPSTHPLREPGGGMGRAMEVE